MKKVLSSIRIISAVVAGLGAANVHAAGFQIMEQNASGLGNAYAGSGAIAENASTIYYNPAGMTRLPGVNVSAGITAIRPSFKFENDGSRVPGATGSNGGDAGSWAAVPNAYISWELTPRWYLGLGIGAPFGLMTEYDDDNWTGRYHSKKFDIKTINVNPSIAYKVNDRLSLGAGVNWMHLDAEFSRAVPAIGPVGYMGDLDATVKLKGDGWGWNLGAQYQVTPETRIGLSYRSKVKIDPDGTTKLSNHNVPAPIPARSVNAATSVELPDSAILSVVHDLNSQWQLLADVSWTGWSSIQSLDIDNGALGQDSLDLRFRDTWRIALGVNYKLDQQWTLKGGVAWDQSPIDSDTYRPTSLPDNNRYWVSVGAQYNFNDRTTVDVGYTHLFLKSTSINNDTDATKGTVRGNYKSNANLIGVQVSHRF
ncbi:fatty acid transporter [Pollutimonas subterranea]|uniref:Fatty acid transporter n=1 Tax=Pollutimonas subterranea TaxID=2045210 RepID=A0A2N4U045_9BURK|nr:porin [Pollutimonas subterranea]PLC48389.1 fatty acid transporter [Pollutimonas subterranea]